eukprot:5681189-Pyramimonas_sp.AAC.1
MQMVLILKCCTLPWARVPNHGVDLLAGNVVHLLDGVLDLLLVRPAVRAGFDRSLVDSPVVLHLQNVTECEVAFPSGKRTSDTLSGKKGLVREVVAVELHDHKINNYVTAICGSNTAVRL